MVQCRLHDGVESPCSDYLVRLWTQVHREQLVHAVIWVAPSCDDLRCQRRSEPSVKHILLADKPVWHATLRLRITQRQVHHGVHWQLIIVRDDVVVVFHFSFGVQAVPDRDWHSEVPLSAYRPIMRQTVGPVGITL